MFSIRRTKWTKSGFQITSLGLVAALVWLLHQTQGAAIAEIYYLITAPFQPQPNSSQVITNARLQELNSRLLELEQQNQNLQKLLGYVQQQQKPAITAPVIGRNANYWRQQLIIGRGSAHGIKVDDVVMGVGGLVGRVVEVTPHTSRVLLISDYSSQVGVMLTRTRDMGYLQGGGSQEAVMDFLEKVPDVQVGDIVTTSPVSHIFPPGFPVGKVKSVNLNAGPAPKAIVELTAPLEHLEWVVVHPAKSVHQ